MNPDLSKLLETGISMFTNEFQSKSTFPSYDIFYDSETLLVGSDHTNRLHMNKYYSKKTIVLSNDTDSSIFYTTGVNDKVIFRPNIGIYTSPNASDFIMNFREYRGFFSKPLNTLYDGFIRRSGNTPIPFTNSMDINPLFLDNIWKFFNEIYEKLITNIDALGNEQIYNEINRLCPHLFSK